MNLVLIVWLVQSLCDVYWWFSWACGEEDGDAFPPSILPRGASPLHPPPGRLIPLHPPPLQSELNARPRSKCSVFYESRFLQTSKDFATYVCANGNQSFLAEPRSFSTSL